MPASDGVSAANSAPVPAFECPPVVLICFNRVDRVREVINAVRTTQPQRVLVIADGPRAHVPSDAELCAEVRAVVEAEIDWPCQVDRRFSETNQGVEQTVELGLDWVFGLVDRAIVFEDDCVPDPTFFPFAAELLDRYEHDERIAMVSGTRFAIDDDAVFGDLSYVFTTFSLTWGWATWRRAWLRHRASFPRDYIDRPGEDSHAPRRVGHPKYRHGALQTWGGHRYFNEVARARGHEFGWDSQWFRSQALFGTLSVAPAVNMVHNNGFGDDATHTNSSRLMPAAEPIRFPLVHPETPVLNAVAERSLEYCLVRTNGRLARTLRKVIPRGRVRTALRHVAERVVRHR
ncbi:MAG: hypothetical protein ACTHJM_14040 [Marmoricola sp.]